MDWIPAFGSRLEDRPTGLLGERTVMRSLPENRPPAYTQRASRSVCSSLIPIPELVCPGRGTLHYSQMPTRRLLRLKVAIRLVLALVAIAGQSAVVSVSAVADDTGAAAHVEQSGVSLHHAHNEGTCVVCRVLSIHGRTEVQSAPAVAQPTAPSAPPSVLSRRPERITSTSNLSRAPPRNA